MNDLRLSKKKKQDHLEDYFRSQQSRQNPKLRQNKKTVKFVSSSAISNDCRRSSRVRRADNLQKSFQNDRVKIIFLANFRHFTLRHSYRRGLAGLQPVCPVRLCGPTIRGAQYRRWNSPPDWPLIASRRVKYFEPVAYSRPRKIIIIYECTPFPNHLFPPPSAPLASVLFSRSHFILCLLQHTAQLFRSSFTTFRHAALVQYLCLGINVKKKRANIERERERKKNTPAQWISLEK